MTQYSVLWYWTFFPFLVCKLWDWFKKKLEEKNISFCFQKPYQTMGKKDVCFIIDYLILSCNHWCYYPLKDQLVEIVVMELIKIETEAYTMHFNKDFMIIPQFLTVF